MDTNADLPETYDYRDTDTVYPMILTVGAKAKGEEDAKGEEEAKGEESISIDKLLEQYTDHDPGVFSIGGTFGIDSSLFQVELSDVYISVVNVKNDADVKVGFIKFGVNVSNSWFLDLSSRDLAHTCTNTRLQDASSGAKRSLLAAPSA